MSATKPTDVNSELPDQDALAAFANSALGTGRRRRRQAGTGETTSTDNPTPPPGPETEKPVPVEEMPSTPPEPGSARAHVGPTAPVFEPGPQDTAAPSVPTPTRAPEAETPDPPRTEQALASVPGGEVDVRPLAVPTTRTPIPPGLQGGTIEVRIPALGPAGARATQCTVMVSSSVRDRFAHYQLAKKMAGDKEPSNALVVRRAFLYCKRQDLFGKLLTDVYQQHNAVEDEDYDEDGMLGEVIGRRAVRGRLKDSGQQSFRPSEQELVTYDAYSQAYGFPSRSDFLNAVLDEFLPQLPAGRRR